MKNKIISELEKLEKQIKNDNLPKGATATEEWGGADVIIKEQRDESINEWLRDQPLVLSPQKTEPRRRAVITEHSRELSWLFIQLRDIFDGQIDYISKYDFYGSLAQSAIDYLEKNNDTRDLKVLLLTVLQAAKVFLKEGESVDTLT